MKRSFGSVKEEGDVEQKGIFVMERQKNYINVKWPILPKWFMTGSQISGHNGSLNWMHVYVHLLYKNSQGYTCGN